MKYYVVIWNYESSSTGTWYEVDHKKPIADELIRVIKENNVILFEGYTITFETRRT